jgi:hypothetical protein
MLPVVAYFCGIGHGAPTVAVTPIPSPDGLATQKDICIKSNASLHLAILKLL